MPSAVALEVVDTTKFHPIVLLQSNAQQTWIEYQTKDFVNDSLSLDSLQGRENEFSGINIRRLCNDSRQQF